MKNVLIYFVFFLFLPFFAFAAEWSEILEKKSYIDALLYCSNLDKDGYTWQLPTRKELLSLSNKYDRGQFWTRDSSPDPNQASYFDFSSRKMNDYEYQEEKINVICVRKVTQNEQKLESRANLAEQRVKQQEEERRQAEIQKQQQEEVHQRQQREKNRKKATWVGLNKWSSRSEKPMDWYDAKYYCDNLNEDGYYDWRLPTISELRTLVKGCFRTESDGPCGVRDSCRAGICWTSSCFASDYPHDSSGYYSKLGDAECLWSKSEKVFESRHVWLLCFGSAWINHEGKLESSHYVRCVR